MKLRTLKIAVLLTLVLGLVVGVALPGLAAPNELDETQCKPRPGIIRGVVYSVDDDNQEFFTIKDGDITIQVNKDTRYFKLTIPQKLIVLRHRIALEPQEQEEPEPAANMPMKLRAIEQAPSLAKGRAFRGLGPVQAENRKLAPDEPASEDSNCRWWNLRWLRGFGEKATFDDIDKGDRVIVWVAPGNDEPLAKVVLIIQPGAYGRISGTVSDIDEIDETSGTITIDTEDESTTVTYDSRTTFLLRGTPSLKEDMKAVVTYTEEGGTLLAKSVMAKVPSP